MQKIKLKDLLDKPSGRNSISGLNFDSVECSEVLPLETEVLGITRDSREVAPGVIFFALSGANHGAGAYLEEVISKKPLAVVLGRDSLLKGEVSEDCLRKVQLVTPVLKVDEPREWMAEFSARFNEIPSNKLCCIAITGTNGKTSLAWLISKALASLGKASLRTGTLGSYLETPGETLCLEEESLTTPESCDYQRLLRKAVDLGAEFSVSEVSSHALSQFRTSSTSWDLGVCTNISRDHLDYHKTMSRYVAAKGLLFSRELLASQKINKVAILTSDCFSWDSESEEAEGKLLPKTLEPAGVKLLAVDTANGAEFVELKAANSLIKLVDYKLAADGLELRLKLDGEAVYLIKSRLLGAYNAKNLVIAFAGLWGLVSAGKLSASPEELSDALGAVEPVPGRMEAVKVEQQKRPTVIVDYSHTPDALKSALQTIKELKPRRLYTVFGCGGDRDKGKRPLMAKVAEDLSDFVLVTNDNPRGECPESIARQIEAGFSSRGKTETILDRASAIKEAINRGSTGDIVLIAGKGHENYQLIGDKKKYFSDRECALENLNS